jgi:excisionase family DNA binding protein
MNVPSLDIQGVRVRTFTRWVDEGGKQLPRELVVEVRGHAGSLDEAAAKFAAIARPVATMVGFVANVRVGPLEVHLAYDCTLSSEDREFLETFIPDEQGAVSEGRIIRRHLMAAACNAFVSLATDSPRVSRALRQYELALREWYVGGEWLALNHLWIAAENLTKAVIRKTVAARGISEETLAREHGLVTDDPARPRWRDLLGARVREQIVFAGDTETYKAAKDASDGLEHGIWELDKVAALALKSTDKTFQYVRRTIRVEDAAQLLNVGRSAIYDLIRSGQLRSIKIGKSRRIPREAVDEVISALAGED